MDSGGFAYWPVNACRLALPDAYCSGVRPRDRKYTSTGMRERPTAHERRSRRRRRRTRMVAVYTAWQAFAP